MLPDLITLLSFRCASTPAGCSPDKNTFGHGWISSSSRLHRHHHALLLLLPVTDDGRSATRLGQEHNDQGLTDPDPTAHFVVSHIARQSSAAPTLGFHSHWWSRQCVICAPQLHLKHRAHVVTRVASLRVAHADLRQNAMHVALQLA